MTPDVSGFAGLKVAIRPVATSSTTDDAITGVIAGAGPVTVNVAVVIDRGSIRNPEGTLKVALMLAPGHTPVAFADGLVLTTETFAGAVGPAVVNVQT